MIAIGNTKATGSVFEKIGSLSKEECKNTKHTKYKWSKNVEYTRKIC